LESHRIGRVKVDVQMLLNGKEDAGTKEGPGGFRLSWGGAKVEPKAIGLEQGLSAFFCGGGEVCPEIQSVRGEEGGRGQR